MNPNKTMMAMFLASALIADELNCGLLADESERGFPWGDVPMRVETDVSSDEDVQAQIARSNVLADTRRVLRAGRRQRMRHRR